jgi:hypothetical protein
MTTSTLATPQKPTEALADPLEYISASRLKCFQTCRLQFYFRYVKRIPTSTSPALFVGRIVHSVLQQWNMRRWRGEEADTKALWPYFSEHWHQDQPEEGIDWKDKETEQKAKAWGMLEYYLKHTPIPLDEKPQAVEVMVERDFYAAGLPPLKGIIDLVRDGGKIVDFKTAARTPTSLQAEHLNEVQLSCYAVLYREATGQKESGVELHHLIKTKEPKLVITPLAPMSADQGRRLMAIMESYVRSVGAEDFIPSPGQHCSWCDYLPQCRKWNGGEA